MERAKKIANARRSQRTAALAGWIGKGRRNA